MNRINQDVAGRLEEAARLLQDQGADRFRVGAYLRAASSVRAMQEPLDQVLRNRGLDGLKQVPHVGEAIELLPPAQRSVLILRTIEHLEPDEVSALLGLSEGNQRVEYARAPRRDSVQQHQPRRAIQHHRAMDSKSHAE